MKNKKHIALVMAVILLLGGCGSGVREYTTPTPDAQAGGEPTPEPTATVEIKDYSYAFTKYDPDEIVMTIDGIEITWREFFYKAFSVVKMYEDYFGEIADWNELSVADTSITTEELVGREVYANLKLEAVLKAHARDMGLSVSQEDMQGLAAEVDAELEQLEASGYDAKEVLDTYFLTKESYLALQEAGLIYKLLLEEMFGSAGEKCTDEEIEAFIEENEITYSKHILLLNTKITDESTGATEPLTEEEMAERLTLAEDIVAQLDAAEDKDAKFNELMREYTEDTGFASYPDGYVFGAASSIAAEYRETLDSLLPGEYSGVVESTFGYHIIMRMEPTPEAVVEVSSTDTITLRREAALTTFGILLDTWTDEAVMEYGGKFEGVTFESIFGK